MASLQSLREGVEHLESKEHNEALKKFLQGHHIGLKVGDATGAHLCSKFLLQNIPDDQQSSHDVWARLSFLLTEIKSCEGEEQAWAVFYTGLWELWRGRDAIALEWLQESYRLATTYLLKFEVCGWLGDLHHYGDLSLAVRFYREAKEAAIGLQQRDLQVYALYKLCQSLCQLEKIEEAQEEHGCLERLANQSDDPFARGAERRIKANISGGLLQHHQSKKANLEAVGLLQQLQIPKLDDFYYQRYSCEPDATLLCPRKIQIALGILMTAWDDIGTYEFLFGDPKLALDAFSEEKTLATEHESDENLMDSLSGLSNICCILGRLAEAEAYATEMLEISSESINALLLLARIEYYKSGGFQDNQEAFQIAETFLAKAEEISKTDMNIRHRPTVHYWQAFLRMKASKNDFEEAIKHYEESIYWFNETESRFVSSSLGRISHFERAKAAYCDLQLCLLNSEPEQVKHALIWAERGRARDLVYELKSRGHIEEPLFSFEEDYDKAWEEIESIYNSAGDDTVFLVFTQLSNTIVVTYLLHAGEEPKFCFSHDETSDHHRVSERSIAEGRLEMPIFSMVQELLRDHVHKKECADCKALTYFYSLLIEPWEAELDRIKPRKMIIIPTQELSILPFAALRDPKTEDEEESCYLIERYALSYAPSLRVFKHCESRLRKLIGEQGPENKKALVVGNPKLKQQNELPNAESEAVSAAGTLQKAGYVTELLLQDAATTQAVLGAISTSDWVHIASHAVVDQRFPFGAVLLSSSTKSQPEQQKLTFLSISRNIGLNHPMLLRNLQGADESESMSRSRGEVSGEEMTQAELKAMVVVLSACSTGLGHVSGEGMLGLSRSLHLAGVAATIVSLWNVDDLATKKVFDHLYENLGRGMELIFALQAAMKSMIELEDDWGHKVHEVSEWAPFMISGSILAKLT